MGKGIGRLAVTVGFASIIGVLGMAFSVSQTYAAPPGLDNPPSDDAVAWIELYAQLGEWQQPWTVVQWQDASGAWNDVDGWRGTFISSVNGFGERAWGVGQEHFGEGPFRWIVYEKDTGTILAQSRLFFLPTKANQTAFVVIVP